MHRSTATFSTNEMWHLEKTTSRDSLLKDQECGELALSLFICLSRCFHSLSFFLLSFLHISLSLSFSLSFFNYHSDVKCLLQVVKIAHSVCGCEREREREGCQKSKVHRCQLVTDQFSFFTPRRIGERWPMQLESLGSSLKLWKNERPEGLFHLTFFFLPMSFKSNEIMSFQSY